MSRDHKSSPEIGPSGVIVAGAGPAGVRAAVTLRQAAGLGAALKRAVADLGKAALHGELRAMGAILK